MELSLAEIAPSLIITNSNRSTEPCQRFGNQVHVIESILSGSRPTRQTATPGGHDAAAVLSTSGSTQLPKGVIQSQRFLMADAYRRTLGHRFTAHDKLSLLYRPSTMGTMHTYLQALMDGVSPCPADTRSRYSATVLQALDELRVTVLHMVPTVFRRIFFRSIFYHGDPIPGFNQLRLMILGGGPANASDMAAFNKPPLPNVALGASLGSGEFATLATNLIYHGTGLSTSRVPAGAPFYLFEVTLLAPDGSPVAQGEIGEITIKCRFIFSAYHNHPTPPNNSHHPKRRSRKLIRSLGPNLASAEMAG